MGLERWRWALGIWNGMELVAWGEVWRVGAISVFLSEAAFGGFGLELRCQLWMMTDRHLLLKAFFAFNTPTHNMDDRGPCSEHLCFCVWNDDYIRVDSFSLSLSIFRRTDFVLFPL